MKIAFHITHYQVAGRAEYLRRVLGNLSVIPHDLNVFIYTNVDLPFVKEFEKLKIRVIKARFRNFRGSRRFLSFVKTFSHRSYVRIAQRIDPFYLTWVNRKYVLETVDQYDVQVYLEDDLGFTNATLDYWQKYSPVCIRNGYNLGFLLTEEDGESNRRFCAGLWESPERMIEIEGKKFLLNDVNPYCAFWIYNKDELKEFTKSREWEFRFRGYGVRERSAVGWHGLGMKRYRGTVIPLLQNGDGGLSVDPNSAVPHYPNNYVGHDYFCKVEFPISFDGA